MKKEKLAFEHWERGFTIKAWYLEKPNKGDSQVEIFKDGKILREFLYPSYKIWNLSAHFSDIVDGELSNSTIGYDIAGSDGLGGTTVPKPIKP